MAQKIYIYGKHAIEEVLTHAPAIVRKIYLAPGADTRLRDLISKSGVTTEKLDPRRATSMVERNAPHQGVVALISLGQLVMPVDKFMDTLKPAPGTLLVLLSEVQDPHNVGAVIRSSAALGASAVLIPTQKQSPITPAVIKASAGMACHLPLVELPNMQQGLALLKKKGFKVYGLSAAGSPIEAQPFNAPAVLVLGNEAAGVAPAARALCDEMLSIGMEEGAESLNVAAAASIALFAWRLRQGRA